MLFKKDVGIDLETERSHYLLGETVAGRIRVLPREQVDVKGATVELLCANEYQGRETSSSSSTSGGSTTTFRRTAKLTIESHDFASRRHLEAEEVVEEQFAFAIPPASAPTAMGSITKVRWEIRARVRVSRSRDSKAAAAITVLSVASYSADSADQPPKVRADDCLIALEFAERNIPQGGQPTGTLVMTPFDDLKARRIRMHLERVENVPQQIGNTSVDLLAELVPAVEARVLPGNIPQRYPFAVDLPPDACPTLDTEASSVRWRLVAAVDRRLRRDEEVAFPIAVYSSCGKDKGRALRESPGSWSRRHGRPP